MSDWILRPEPDFDRLLAQHQGYLASNQAALGVSAANHQALTARATACTQAQAARDDYERQGAPLYQRLRAARAALEGEWRTLDGEIMARRDTTDEQRRGLGRAVPDTVRTAAGAPASHPVVVKVEAGQRLSHILHWRDENTPDSKAKPPGVTRAILFQKIGPPAPAGPGEMHQVAADSATPYLAEFTETDAGKPCCRENSRGERSPFSAVTTWTIPG